MKSFLTLAKSEIESNAALIKSILSFLGKPNCLRFDSAIVNPDGSFVKCGPGRPRKD